MNESNPFSVSAVQKKREQDGIPAAPGGEVSSAATPRPATAAAPGGPAGGAPAEPEKTGGGLPFDPARLLAALLRGWYWFPLAGLLLAIPLGLYGYFKFQTGYYVDIQLIRREVTTTIRASALGDAFKPSPVSVATLISLMQSPKLLERVGSEATPRISPDALLGQLTIKQEKDTELITVTLKTKTSPAATAELINLYAKEVELLTGQMQADEAAELDKFLRDQIAKTDLELETVNKELLDFRRENEFFGEDRELEAYLRQLSDAEVQVETAKTESETAAFRITSLERELARQNPANVQLAQARGELANLRVSYTDDNPIVKDALDKIADLEKQAAQTAQAGTNQEYQFSQNNTAGNDLYMEIINLRDRQAGLANQIKQLGDFRDSIQEKLKKIPEKSQHYAQIMAHQQSMQATRDLLAGRQHEAQVYEDNPPGFYREFAPATPDSVEESNRWKKIIIITIVGFVFALALTLFTLCGLELMNLRIISAGDLRRVTGVPVAERVPELGDLDEAALAQWRFRVWAHLLRQLNLQNAPRVTLAFASAQAGEGKSCLIRQLRDAARDRRLPVISVTNAPGEDGKSRIVPLADALAAPDLVVRHLRENPGQPLDLVYDAAWQWSLENRARWQRASELWQAIPSFALLVELPALSNLDALLLAEVMPKVIWVTASNALQQRDLAGILQMVEAGEIPLAAAVINREPPILSKFAFLGKFGLFLLLSGALVSGARAGTVATNAPAAPTNAPVEQLSFSSSAPHLAGWQQRLTVGPGDAFNFSLYGKAGTIRNDVTVGPDGRLSYLEAQSVPVSGLTVDEMRAKLDSLLVRYYHNPRTTAVPVTWRSKKYLMLGAIMDRGVYILDRPLTVIEAVARARGIATGLYEHNTIELADMPRSFLVRNGRRVPVDFERLFNKGDLSQNVLIEPGDYLFFPSGTVNEVYLFGAVGNQGPLGLTAETSLIGVLTVRGGFAPNAYRQRVLIVRGSLDHPQTFAVNVNDILSGRSKDFTLQPRDIIYVANKPWQRAEELTQMAVGSFVQTMTATWAGAYIGPIITHAVLPPP